jgi:hypothetical protein
MAPKRARPVVSEEAVIPFVADVSAIAAPVAVIVPDLGVVVAVSPASKRRRVIESEDEDDEEDEDGVESEDEEETEEDRAFINDGRVEKTEVDVAAVDVSNIITSTDGGRPRRNRKEPTRWEHPDAAQVMKKFCDKWNVTDKDLEAIMTEDVSECDDPEDPSFRDPENENEDESSESSAEEDDNDDEPTATEDEEEEEDDDGDEDYDEEDD